MFSRIQIQTCPLNHVIGRLVAISTWTTKQEWLTGSPEFCFQQHLQYSTQSTGLSILLGNQTLKRKLFHDEFYTEYFVPCDIYQNVFLPILSQNNCQSVYREYQVPVFEHFSILGKLERGKHGEALAIHVYLSKTSLIY